jgi:hypothetical protein
MSSIINHKRSISGTQTYVKRISNAKPGNVGSKNISQKESLTPSKNIVKISNPTQTKLISIKPSILSIKNPFFESQKHSSLQSMYEKNKVQKKNEMKKDSSLNLSNNQTNLNNSINHIYHNVSHNQTKSLSAIVTFGNKIPLNRAQNLLREKPSSSQIKLKRNVKKMDISNQSLSGDSFTTGITTEKTSRINDKSFNISSRRLNNSNVSRDANKSNLTMTMSSERVSTIDKLKPKPKNFLTRSPDTKKPNTSESQQRDISPSFYNGNSNIHKPIIPINRETSKHKIPLNNKVRNNILSVKPVVDKSTSPFKLVKNEPKKNNFRDMNTSPLLRVRFS